MVKRISWIGLAALFGMGAVTLYYPDFARAAGAYKLEYPQGYGNCCPANAKDYGYFRTGWREWPGEIRRDKTFPRSISMELIPTPEGQKTIPPPKAKKSPEVPSETLPKPAPEEGMEKPPEETPGQELPGEKPTEPGKETPTLPGLPTEPGGFNPLPGLPSDLAAPTPLNPKEKEENNPTTESKKETESKQETEPKTDSPEKNKNDVPTPGPKPEASGTQIISPFNSIKVSRLDPIRHSSDVVRGATYHEPAESPMTARFSRDIVPQSYQKPGEANESSAVARSELQIDVLSNELRQNAVSVALDGFCPVELNLHGQWVQGDPRWSVVHKGFIYRLSGNAQRQEFLADPEKFIPANGGFDPVTSLAEKRNVPGQVNFCAAYKGRIYMFSSAATQASFYENPKLYVGGAMK